MKWKSLQSQKILDKKRCGKLCKKTKKLEKIKKLFEKKRQYNKIHLCHSKKCRESFIYN